jgi:hypothetical protein
MRNSVSDGVCGGHFLFTLSLEGKRGPFAAPFTAFFPDDFVAAADMRQSNTSGDNLHKLLLESINSNWRHTPRLVSG